LFLEDQITRYASFSPTSTSKKSIYMEVDDCSKDDADQLDLLCNKLFYCDQLFNKCSRNWKIERKFLVD